MSKRPMFATMALPVGSAIDAYLCLRRAGKRPDGNRGAPQRSRSDGRSGGAGRSGGGRFGANKKRRR